MLGAAIALVGLPAAGVGATALVPTPAPPTSTSILPPGSTPTTILDPSSTSSTTTSTTTTTTRPHANLTRRRRAPKTATTTTTTTSAAASGDAPDTVPVPAVGPPDVTNLRLPSDSLAAAEAELDILRSRLQQLEADDANTARALAVDGPALDAARRARDELVARHRRNAAAVYEALTAGALADQFVQSMSPDVESARRRELLDAATESELRRTERLERRFHDLDRKVTDARRHRVTLAHDLAATRAEITIVFDKLAAAAAALTLVGIPLPAPSASGPLAIAAHAAETALVLTTANQHAPAGPLTAAVAADYAAKRATVARLVADVDPTADPHVLDAVWATTPEPAMRSVLFALSQVGKPYVYATDGPATYDCSGLTKRAWAETGIGLPHFSGAQLHAGFPVAVPQLRPGDLLAYGLDGAQHVVLYLGAGTVVQAEGRAWGVVVTPANLDPARGFAGASRPVP